MRNTNLSAITNLQTHFARAPIPMRNTNTSQVSTFNFILQEHRSLDKHQLTICRDQSILESPLSNHYRRPITLSCYTHKYHRFHHLYLTFLTHPVDSQSTLDLHFHPIHSLHTKMHFIAFLLKECMWTH